MNNNIPKVVITKLPRTPYYEWFILGFYMLEEQGLIKFKMHVDWVNQLAKITDNDYIIGGLRHYFQKDHFKNGNLEGYIDYNNEKKYFCIDSADSPFIFSSRLLNKVSVYFKMQCPIAFEKEGFALNDNIRIPYIDYEYINGKDGERKPCYNLFENIGKIKPLMVGARRLSYGISYKFLKKAYINYKNSSVKEPSKKLMCYFGNALGPRESNIESHIDYTKESNLVTRFKGELHHPNEKRKIAVDIIKSMGSQYDARLINESNSDNGKKVSHPELVIPLEKFCDHIANFEYNLNISGYRLSIPNRFIESFVAGTAILTDKLALKWYKPFGKEVVETIPMGYLKEEEVRWDLFKHDLEILPPIKKEDIIKEFNDKWAPQVVSNYIVDEVIKSSTLSIEK